MKKEIKTYAISIAIALAVGGLSALFTAGNMDIYSESSTRKRNSKCIASGRRNSSVPGCFRFS